MSLALDASNLRARVEALGAFARKKLADAAEHATRLHAEELALEHVLTALFQDEASGAAQLVIYAFADPETLAQELLALSPGIMVVGSGRSLPFSVRGVEALERARATARARGGETVEAADVFAGAFAALSAELRSGLSAAARSELVPAVPPAAPSPAPDGFFRVFSSGARRALGAASRAAGAWQRAAISPAHLVLGALEADAGAAEAGGLTASRARMVLGGHDADETPPAARRIAPDTALADLIGALEPESGTVAILGLALERGSEEVRALLARQKVTPALYARARHAFPDPVP